MLAFKSTPARRLAGGLALAVLCAGAGLAAWAAQAPAEEPPPAASAAGDTPAVVAEEPAVQLPRVIALTNADEAGSDFAWGSLDGSASQIRSAVAQGDPRRAFLLGGAAIEVAAAIGANGGPDAELMSNAETAHFVNLDGRPGLLVFGPGAERGKTIAAPLGLDGLAPPPDALTPARWR